MKPLHHLDFHKTKAEFRLSGRAVSRGIAVGSAVCLYGHARQFYRHRIAPSEVAAELERLDSAVRATLEQLSKMVTKATGGSSVDASEILATHLLILEDVSFVGAIKTQIETDLVNSEWAAKTVIDGFVERYKKIDDVTIRERYVDVEDVGERLQIALGGSAESYTPVTKNSILIATELRPSTLIEAAERRPSAIVTENGGWTSHSFIISRELNLPAVTGIANILRRVEDGDIVIVNGYTGEIIVNPTAATLKAVLQPLGRPADATRSASVGEGVVRTLDGRSVFISANADSPSVYARAKTLGAAGIGLFRSEYLFNRAKGFPSEQEQIDAYTAIADAAGNDGVKIRTFDLNRDAVADRGSTREKNPALGMRAVRMSLADERELSIQLRALLIASFERKIDIVIPMITGVAEIRRISAALRREKLALVKSGTNIGEPRLGAMIEVPSAVLTVDLILEEVGFISLGTNDLVQYILAVDRDNESVAEWFASLHPGVLRAITRVVGAAAAADKELVICGEMAGSPYYIPLLIGLGARRLSMNVNSVAAVRSLIAGIAYEEARAIALDCLERSTPEAVELVLLAGIRKKWGPLFPAHFDFRPKA